MFIGSVWSSFNCCRMVAGSVRGFSDSSSVLENPGVKENMGNYGAAPGWSPRVSCSTEQHCYFFIRTSRSSHHQQHHKHQWADHQASSSEEACRAVGFFVTFSQLSREVTAEQCSRSYYLVAAWFLYTSY